MITRIHLPDHWTMEQAEFVHDLADLLYEAVWRQYGQKLCEYWGHPESDRNLFDDDCEPAAAETKT